MMPAAEPQSQPATRVTAERLVDIVLNHTQSTTTARLVLVTLAINSVERITSMTLRDIAAQASVCERNARKGLRDLETLGEIQVIAGDCSLGLPNSYRVVIDCVSECSGMDHHWPDRKSRRKREISRSLRTAVFERDAYRCCACGSWKDLRADHIHPESKGGPTTLENLQTLCNMCNTTKGDMLPGQWDGFVGRHGISEYERPA